MHPRLVAELAAFLDAPEGRDLGLPRAVARRVGESVFGCALERLGSMPWELEAEELGALLEQELPRQFGRRDPDAAAVPAFLQAYLEYAASAHLAGNQFERQAALERSVDAFRAAVERGSGDPAAAAATESLATRGRKVGRNDPCPCGSGRKFKRCCGGSAQGPPG